MKIGCPPTPPNARAGLLTPPGMSWQALAKADWLWVRCISKQLLGVGASGLIVAQHFDDMLGQGLLDLSMARHWLGDTGVGIAIPIVLALAANEFAAEAF